MTTREILERMQSNFVIICKFPPDVITNITFHSGPLVKKKITVITKVPLFLVEFSWALLIITLAVN